MERFLCKLRSNFQYQILFIECLDRFDKKTDEEVESLVDLFCHFFFENLLKQTENDELIIFCYLLLEREVDQMNSPSASSFLDVSFIGKILKSLAKKSELKLYFSMILNELILNVENNTDNFLEIDINR